MREEKRFPKGFIPKKPRDTAPGWVKMTISIKREELIEWLQNEPGDWVNLQVSEARSGKWYATVDDWKPGGGSNDR